MTKPMGDLPLDQDEVDWSQADAKIDGEEIVAEKVKSSEERLKKAFVDVYNMVSDILDTLDVDPELKLRRIRERVARGIAGSNDTDLERLVEWVDATHKEVKEESGTLDAWDKGYLSALFTVRKHIAEEFGVGGEGG